ncbi:MAG TPA: hypothetical protein VKD72_36315, partial [Gemmataceae bacterium]|nr:hypothetical protein [Gemmataceae bacterium]
MKKRTWALALGVALAGAAGAGPVVAQPPAAGKPVAVVNGEPITLANIDTVINRDGPKAVQIPEGKLREMRHAALGMMID